MSKKNWIYTPIDTTQGMWLNADRNESGSIDYSIVIAGATLVITEAQYYEFHNQISQTLEDGQRSGRMRVLRLLKENLDRFDYSNNRCEPLSFDEFVKMAEQ